MDRRASTAVCRSYVMVASFQEMPQQQAEIIPCRAAPHSALQTVALGAQLSSYKGEGTAASTSSHTSPTLELLWLCVVHIERLEPM